MALRVLIAALVIAAGLTVIWSVLRKREAQRRRAERDQRRRERNERWERHMAQQAREQLRDNR